jgi:hypothetical protein
MAAGEFILAVTMNAESIRVPLCMPLARLESLHQHEWRSQWLGNADFTAREVRCDGNLLTCGVAKIRCSGIPALYP